MTTILRSKGKLCNCNESESEKRERGGRDIKSENEAKEKER